MIFEQKNIIVHPFYNEKYHSYLPKKVDKIIVGTFPPKKLGDNDLYDADFFYYSSSQNQLWNTIKDAFKFDKEIKFLKSGEYDKSQIVNNQKEFCEKYSVGFLDVFTKIKRQGDVDSSKDTDIRPIETIFSDNKFEEVVNDFDIKCFFTVYKLAYETLLIGLSSNKAFKIEYINYNNAKIPKPAFNESLKVTYKDKNFEVIPLFPATRSNNTKEEKLKQYHFFLKEK